MVVVVSWTAVASAAPATVVAPGAQARATAAETAEVLRTYTAGERVFVSPAVTAGFRRISLPDKRIGFIRDDDVRLDAPAPAPVQPLSTSTARPLFLVRNARELAGQVKDDSLLAQRANDHVSSQHAQIAAIGIASAAALVTASLGLVFTENQCVGSGSTQLCQQTPNFTFLAVGGAMFLAGGITALALSPTEELVGIVNDWNARHPNRPLALAPMPAPTPDPPPPTLIPGVDFPI